MTASAPIAARRLGDALRRAGEERSRVTFPSSLFKGRILDFARDVLGIRSLASHQAEVLLEWQKDGRVEIIQCTGQKLGKTADLEIAPAYDFATTPRLNGFVFGPKLEHTNEVFWPRFALLMLAAYLPCKACRPVHEAWCALVEADPSDETPRPERCPRCSPLVPSKLKDPKKPEDGRVSEWLDVRNSENGLRAPDGRAVRGYVGRKEGSKGGFSGEVRFYCDEGSDISDVDRETIRGNMSGGGKAMFAGNMLYTWGWFYRAFRQDKHSGGEASRQWGKAPTGELTFQMSSRLSPNCPGRIEWSDGVVTENHSGDRPVRGMATREDIEANLKAWKGTNLILARIDARPPAIVDGHLVSTDRVRLAEGRFAANDNHTGVLQFGVDVARVRDRFAVAVRRGKTIVQLYAEVLGDDDYGRAVNMLIDMGKAHRRAHERKPRLVYDASGLEGDKFSKELRAQRADEHFDVFPIFANHKPRNTRLYLQRRDELAYHFAAWLQDGALPVDGELEAEIDATTAKPVDFTWKGQTWKVQKVIDNDDLRPKLGRSPDKRNACELATWDVDGSEAVDAPLVDSSPNASPAHVQAPRTAEAPPPSPMSIYERQAAAYRSAWGRAS